MENKRYTCENPGAANTLDSPKSRGPETKNVEIVVVGGRLKLEQLAGLACEWGYVTILRPITFTKLHIFQ